MADSFYTIYNIPDTASGTSQLQDSFNKMLAGQTSSGNIA